MKKVFDMDNPVFRFMGHVFDMILLNFLWVFTSLPIVTMGASTAALHAVTCQQLTHRDTSVIKDYFRAWKNCWKDGSKLFLALAIPEIVLVCDIWYFSVLQTSGGNAIFQAFSMVLAAILFLVVITGIYAFPAQTMFENSVKNHLKNGFLLALKYLPRSLLTVLFDIAYLGLTALSLVYVPAAAMFFLFFGAALVIHIHMRFLLPVLKRYLPKE